jgi:hypothetical protein
MYLQYLASKLQKETQVIQLTHHLYLFRQAEWYSEIQHVEKEN